MSGEVILRERWEQGVHNARRLFSEIQKRGYNGSYTQVKKVVRAWRAEGQERAFVRFETAPGEQAQMDWGHFGNWGGHRLYAFALTLSWSRMRYVEFTQRQDSETLLNCLVHAFHYFCGVTATLLTDNMKTVVTGRSDGVPQWNPRFLDFAGYYGFVPRVCHPYRPETKGKIEASIRYLRVNFWPSIQFDSLADPVPHTYVGKTVTVREALDASIIRIFHHQELIAEHKLAMGKGEMVMDREHYRGLPHGPRKDEEKPSGPGVELLPGPGVGLHHMAPVVELRPLSLYEEVAHVAAV
jgi:transposase